jgi:hypothetical protein
MMLKKVVAISMKEYGREKLKEISVELMMEYVHDVVLPKLCKETTGATPTNASSQKDVKFLLKHYGLSCACFVTVCNWMKEKSPVLSMAGNHSTNISTPQQYFY